MTEGPCLALPSISEPWLPSCRGHTEAPDSSGVLWGRGAHWRTPFRGASWDLGHTGEPLPSAEVGRKVWV